MVINPIVVVYIPIIRIPIKGGMTIPNTRSLDPSTYMFKAVCAFRRGMEKRRMEHPWSPCDVPGTGQTCRGWYFAPCIGDDDIITDITELFLWGEYLQRDEKSRGTSSKSLTTLFWNIGNWKRGENWALPSFIDAKKILITWKINLGSFLDQVPENNDLFSL